MVNSMSVQEQAASWLRWLDTVKVNMAYSDQVNYKVPPPDEDVLREAVKNRQDCLLHLHEQPAEDILLEAVSADGYAISYINEPSDAVQLAAIKNQRGAIEYIKDPSIEIQVLALTHGMEPGYFDSENLAFFSNKFTDEALARVNPALIVQRQLYDEDNPDVSDLTEFYDSCQPLNGAVPVVTLPDKLAP